MNKLTRNELTENEVSMVCEKVLNEADMDNDGRLSLEDFQHMIVRAPDFLRLGLLLMNITVTMTNCVHPNCRVSIIDNHLFFLQSFFNNMINYMNAFCILKGKLCSEIQSNCVSLLSSTFHIRI